METKIETRFESGKCKPMKKGIFGFLLLAAGTLLLLFNMELLPVEYRSVVFSWPMLLIAIGLINITSKDSFVLGAILILVGGFFILPKFLVLPINFVSLFWPVLLIAAGLLIMLKKWRFQKYLHAVRNSELSSGYIDETNIFGGNKTKVNTPEFKGGKMVNIFGGSEIDLTQTKLGEGQNILEVVCVFGGFVLIVPADWVIKVEAASVLGGFTDKRLSIKTQNGDNKELIIKGVVVLGGGELKSYG